jgi:hypothetical protein
MNDWPFKFAMLGFLFSLGACMALSACHYDQSPESHRWQGYRLVKVR